MATSGTAQQTPGVEDTTTRSAARECVVRVAARPAQPQRVTEVSVIIPAYDEADRIGPTITATTRYLLAQPYASEIILVDDGSGDATVRLARSAFDAARAESRAEGEVQFRTLRNPGNRGKGYSIRHGLTQARARYVFFSDADLSTPIDEIEKLLAELRAGADLAIGSRALPDSVVDQPSVLRKAMSAVFRTVVRVFAVPTIKDTQCGFKGYRQAAAQRLASLQQLDGFGFDIEHLYVARRLDLKTVEVPVRWKHVAGSKVRPLRDTWRMLWDLGRIRAAHVSLPARRTISS